MAASVKDNLRAEIERAYDRSWKYYIEIKDENDHTVAHEASDWLVQAWWYAFNELYKARRKLKNKDKKGPTWIIR